MTYFTPKRMKRRIFLDLKHFYQDTFTRKKKDKNIVFIMGCQRSGTTMLNELFDRDFAIRTYGEFSNLSSTHRPRLRLNPYPMVEEQISRNHAKTIVLKPLVESQNIDKLFDYFPNSRAIWAYRHYKDVASSNLKIFGPDNGINDLRPIFLDEEDNWRAERSSPSTKEIVKKFFSEDMPKHDAAALFWYVRNVLYFERNLDSNPRVYLCNYKELASNSSEVFKEIYRFIGMPYPNKELTSDVRSSSIGKGSNIELSSDVEALCESLWLRLNEAYAIQLDRQMISA